MRDIENCEHHSPLPGGQAACALIELIARIPSRDAPVGMDACAWCCRQPAPPTKDRPNLVQASFIHSYAIAHQRRDLEDMARSILDSLSPSHVPAPTTTTPPPEDYR